MPSGLWYKQERYREILKEQVTISYLVNGISLTDTDEMTPFDRKLILEIITSIKEKEKEEYEKSLRN